MKCCGANPGIARAVRVHAWIRPSRATGIGGLTAELESFPWSTIGNVRHGRAAMERQFH